MDRASIEKTGAAGNSPASLFPERFPARVCCSGIALIGQIGSLIDSGLLGLAAVKLTQAAHGGSMGPIA